MIKAFLFILISVLISGCVKDQGTPPDPPLTDNSWHIKYLGYNNNFKSVFFVNNRGFIAGNSFPNDSSKFLVSNDGGLNWDKKIITTLSTSFSSIHFRDEANGLICGSGGTILETNDSGTTWNPQSSNTSLPLNAIVSIQGFSVAVGYLGTIAVRTNSSWNASAIDTTIDLFGAYILNSASALTCGNNGRVYLTTNSGTNWNSVSTNTTNGLNSIYFSNTSVGFAVGQNGTILKTSDGGNTWTVLSSGTTKALNGVYVNSYGTIVYIVGEDGTVLRSTNAGSTWSIENSLTTEYLRSIYRCNNIVYAVGENGTLIFRDYSAN